MINPVKSFLTHGPAKHEQIIGLIAQYALTISSVTLQYIQKLHEKRVELWWYSVIKMIVALGNQQSTNTV